MREASKMTAVSLFTGAGGLDIGFERNGFDIVWANEIDGSAADTYSANHPDTHMENMDIADAISDMPTHDIDIVIGGPSCQGFSAAGKMAADDPRSRLIFSFLDAVDMVRPRAFLMENVDNLVKSPRFSKVLARWKAKADSMGYSVMVVVADAADHGVPQHRRRAFFFGLSRSTFGDSTEELLRRFEEELKKLEHPGSTVREAISDLGLIGGDSNPNTCPAKITFAKNPTLRATPWNGMLFNGRGRPIDIDGYAATLPASMGGNRTPIIDTLCLGDPMNENWCIKYHQMLRNNGFPLQGEAPARLRRLTIAEASRLMTFPDDYEWKGSTTSVYRQIGNAVPCNLAADVAEAVKTAIGKEE